MNQIPESALKLGDTLGHLCEPTRRIPAAAAAMGARYPYGNQGEYIPVYQTLMPYPTVIYWSDLYAWNAPLGFSNYQALQIQLNKRFPRVCSSCRITVFEEPGQYQLGFRRYVGHELRQPMDYNNLKLEKSVLEFDQTHVVKIGASYELPLGRRRSFGGEMPRAARLRRWRLDAAVYRELCEWHAVWFRRHRHTQLELRHQSPVHHQPDGGSLLNPSFNARPSI